MLGSKPWPYCGAGRGSETVPQAAADRPRLIASQFKIATNRHAAVLYIARAEPVETGHAIIIIVLDEDLYRGSSAAPDTGSDRT
jgi:hypothetical protein